MANLQFLPFLLCFTFLLFHYVDSISFKISQFKPETPNILYHGDAVPSDNTILFNNVNYNCRVGWATYAQPLPLWDPNTQKIADFTTNFSFIIDTRNSPAYGNGFAFFLSPIGFEIPPNSPGGFLGLFNTTTVFSNQNELVFVEFDSFPNPEWDPAFEHVGINKNSIGSSVSTPWNAGLHSGDTANVHITYNATMRNLSVSWSYQRTSKSQEKTNLFFIVDLMKVLPQWVTIGFSAATGQYGEKHILRSWEFSSNLVIKETKKDNKYKRYVVFVTFSSGIVLALLLLSSLVLWKRKQNQRQKKKTERTTFTSMNDLETAGPNVFTYEDLVLATNNFSSDRKLGEGGFGVVYKGYLTDLDMLIAVKKISRGSKQGRKEYITEVKIISRLRHKNLVQLISWCHNKSKFLLIYEFMPNGSLDSHLFHKKTTPLTWAVRYKITLGLASALVYLHEECSQCVVHRDIKSSNIMLDSNFDAKLGDFGLARLMDHELGPRTTGLAGTLGYMAPEYIYTGRASKGSDVFSFGVVALEIATGKKSVDPMEKSSLVEWVWDLYGKGKLISGIDEKMHLGFDKKQAECLMIVGLWCAHLDCNLRPSIRQAIQVLKFEAEMPNLPNKMPRPPYRLPANSAFDVGSPSLTSSSTT